MFNQNEKPKQELRNSHSIASISINHHTKEVNDDLELIYEATKSMVVAPERAIHGLLVCGSAGIGKTFTVRKAIKDTGLSSNVQYISGKLTPFTLYQALYNNRANHRVLVIDDIDLKDLRIMEMLKIATDIGLDNRVIHWGKSLHIINAQRGTNIPNDFVFCGKVILISNTDLTRMSQRQRDNLQAVMRRSIVVKCYYEPLVVCEYTIGWMEENHPDKTLDYIEYITETYNVDEVDLRTTQKFLYIAS